MIQVASTKDKSKLIVADEQINNAILFESSQDNNVNVLVRINDCPKNLLITLSAEAKLAIIHNLLEHM